MPARLRLRVSPGARRTELVGRHGEGWRVRVAAPPERGRANEAVLELLSASLGVPRADMRLVAGVTSRDKVIEVDGMTTDEAGRLLQSSGRKGEA
jgi:uncharacterized protein